jgi:hypothetical protein
MPAKSRWLLVIPRIVEQLEAMTVPVIDRATCERLFQVRRRQAINLLDGFGGYRSGNAILIDRQLLIRSLHKIEAEPDVITERHRKQRLTEELDKTNRFRSAAHIRIPVAADVHSLTLPKLPDAVQLSPGRLNIQFDGVEQLLTRLYELSQVAANDFDKFRLAAEE